MASLGKIYSYPSNFRVLRVSSRPPLPASTIPPQGPN